MGREAEAALVDVAVALAALAEEAFAGEASAEESFTTAALGDAAFEAVDLEAGTFGEDAFEGDFFVAEALTVGVFPAAFPDGAFVDFLLVVSFSILPGRGCADGSPPSAFT